MAAQARTTVKRLSDDCASRHLEVAYRSPDTFGTDNPAPGTPLAPLDALRHELETLVPMAPESQEDRIRIFAIGQQYGMTEDEVRDCATWEDVASEILDRARTPKKPAPLQKPSPAPSQPTPIRVFWSPSTRNGQNVCCHYRQWFITVFMRQGCWSYCISQDGQNPRYSGTFHSRADAQTAALIEAQGL